MRDDASLGDAFTALREELDGSSDDAPATRRAIMLFATTRRRWRAKLARLVLPLAAVLTMSSAWAATTHRLPSIFYDTLESFRVGPTESAHDSTEPSRVTT